MSEYLIAKPVVKNQYWIVTDGKQKVGNVISDGNGYDLKIGSTITHYNSTKAIANKEKIEFIPTPKSEKKSIIPTYAVFPTGSNKVYNSMLDIRKKIHLFTKTVKSKCYHAAGWFAVKQGAEYVAILCPKYIFIQRYEYYGPFHTEDEAKSMINTL
jgi:hypothetical protein